MKQTTLDESYYVASQWVLIRRKFFKHKLAVISGCILLVFYLIISAPHFFSAYDPVLRTGQRYFPPTKLHFIDPEGKFHVRPFVYETKRTIDTKLLTVEFEEKREQRYPLALFVEGYEYKLFGFIKTNLHLYGTKDGVPAYLLGTDKLGRCMLSRIIHGAKISMTIGLVGVFLSFVLGVVLGGISGYYGGTVDMILQRAIELLLSIPTIPLWMGLAAIIPRDWSMIGTYFAITIVLSFVGWTGLARVVRGKVISLREQDYVMAARISGMKARHIIARHLIPSTISYLLVNLTLAIPYMILGETALSFLGLGIQSPAISWGTLLQAAQKLTVFAENPWLLIPGFFVIVVVLCFNFLGDGLRDAADPYK